MVHTDHTELSPSFSKRIQELRERHVGRFYEVVIDSEEGKGGDPGFRGLDSDYNICGFIRCYGERPKPGDNARIRIDAINPSTRNGTACVVVFATAVYR